MCRFKLLAFPVLGFLLLLTASCVNKPAETNTTEQFEIKLTFDTINVIDSKGRKQGVWFLFKDTLTKSEVSDTVVYKNDNAYPVTASTIKEVIENLNKENK